MTLRVAILTDYPGWHGRELQHAFEGAGVTVQFAKITDCAIDLPRNRAGVAIPGFAGEVLPDAVFVRTIPAGTFQQVTLRLTVLHSLDAAGVPVYNSASAIEKSVDKARTSVLLHQAGIATPLTWVTEKASAARRVLMRETRANAIVFKPLFGSQGEGLQRLASVGELPDAATADGVWYLQRYLDKSDGGRKPSHRDFRLLVAGERVVAAMERRARHWITNYAQGARVRAAIVDEGVAHLAVRATEAVGAGYAGVDVAMTADGTPTVIEVNSIPAWQGLQRVTQVNIAAALVADLMSKVRGDRWRAAR